MFQPYTLHNYFRSSTSIRVRIALNLKQLDYDYVGVALLEDQQHSPEFLARNPQGLVPTLAGTDGANLSQSLAIMEYLDEVHPEPPLLPGNAFERARIRSLAQLIACEIHPVNNLRILKYLKQNLAADRDAVSEWFRHWVALGFEALEARLTSEAGTGAFCHGDTPTLADICLYAQALNNRRFEVDMAAYPFSNAIIGRCSDQPAFAAAEPARQPDAV